MDRRTTPLYPIQESQQAVFGTYGDWHFAMRFGEVAHEYRAARTSVAVADWGFHVLVRLKGPDRQPFLNRLVSNLVQLEPGEGAHAFLLSTTGKPLVEMWVYETGQELLLEVPESLHGRVKDELERYHFRENLEVQDASTEFAALALLGPEARRALGHLNGDPLPELPLYSSARIDLEGVPALCCRTSRTGVEGYVLWVPRSRAAAAWETVLGADPAPEALGMEALEVLRVEAGIPAYGVDYTEDTLYLEMAPMDSYSEEKGCYIGQEVVARILHRGHVNRRLTGLEIEGEEDDPAEPGAPLAADGKEVGRVTSTVVSPALGPIALGYVRREHLAAGTELALPAGRRARVVELPFHVPEEALQVLRS